MNRNRRLIQSISNFLLNAAFFVAIAISVLVSVSFGPKPMTHGKDNGDEHYGEGPAAVLNDYQYEKLQELMARKGHVTKQEFEEIVADTGDEDGKQNPFRPPKYP